MSVINTDTKNNVALPNFDVNFALIFTPFESVFPIFNEFPSTNTILIDSNIFNFEKIATAAIKTQRFFMKKTLVSALAFLTILFSANAQQLQKNKAMELVLKNISSIGLSEYDLKNTIVSDAYVSSISGVSMVYLQQTHKGLPVFNSIVTLAFKNETLVSNQGFFIEDMTNKSGLISIIPSLGASDAVKAAIASKKLYFNGVLKPTALLPGRKFDFGKAGIASENITAELLWTPVEDGKAVKLAWQVYLVPTTTSDYWMIRVDAHTGKIISENNLTVSCNWDKNNKANNLSAATNNYLFLQSAASKKADAKNTFFEFPKTNLSPSLISNASYKVIPFPAESPWHPGGTPALVTNPWTRTTGNATSLKWHNNGTTDYINTRGNNVWAQEDVDGNNTGGTYATSTTTTEPLSFNFTPNFTLAPTESVAAPNQQFNITNLFYWNNLMHDISYQYGFDEASGNFQFNNQNRGGTGNDFVIADAQDGSGTNNANFSAPADGSSGRMQMYLWSAVPGLTVNTPASIAGDYQAVESAFSSNNKLVDVGPVTGQVVYYNDNAAGSLHEACSGAPVNSVAGKIALIDRANCNFTVKVKNAETAGAIAVIMVNNVAGSPVIMGGTDNTITIPAVMVSIDDGLILKGQLNNNLNVTLAGGQLVDGDIDNGVIAHEYTHGISIRLTGGPSQSSCLNNAEQMGEGWSDYFSLMVTQDWPNSNVNSGFANPRSIGTYVIGQLPTDNGIRSQKYCTDFSVNNKVYAASIPSEIHDLGEIWCATLWDMTWNIIQQTNSINTNIFNPTGTGGNSIALKLVTEGMKLQPCSPGFIDGRNAILKADSILYGGAYDCAIREAFRRRGMGLYASQGSSASVTDQVADYTPLLTMVKSQNITQAQEGQNIVYTTSLSSCSPLTNYTLRDTLPQNVTYVSGGTYDPTTRVVSFPVNFATAQTQNFAFTVKVNAGSYFTSQTLMDERFTTTTMPATFTPSSTTVYTWSVSSAQSQSSPNSLFTPDASATSDQKIATTNAIALGSGPISLGFGHRYITQSGFDGGVVEISTDGGTNWTDIGNNITSGYYSGTIASSSTNPLAGKKAWTGSVSSFVKSSINLSAYENQSIKFRFRFGSNNSVAGTGWYVDDILLKREPVVNIRSNLFDAGGIRITYCDTVTKIIQGTACLQVSLASSPSDTTVCIGNNASFSVNAGGTNPTYQWQVSTDGGVNYTNIIGAVSQTLTLTNVTSSLNNNRYRVLVSNTCPSTVTSDAATLTANTPAAISVQPSDVSVCVGSNATFTVTATGSANTYQWQVSTDAGATFSNISGATSTTLNLGAVNSTFNGNRYRLVISSCSPTPLNSSSVILNVSNQASISVQPTNTPACTGSSATFSVNATGSSLVYQWQISTDGGVSYSNISGAVSASYTIATVTSSLNNNRYRVLISSSCGSDITSNAGTLVVSDPASLTLQPTATTVCEGSNASFSVAATGTNISYQWQVSTNGGATFANINGATSSTLTLTNVSASQHNNQYRAVLFSCSATGLNSNAALLNVTNLPSFSSQPTDVNACEGSDAVFSVTAAGTNVIYQWQKSTDGGATFNDISGANTSSYTLSNVSISQNNNKFRVVISNTCNNGIASSAATLLIGADASITSQPAATQACSGSTVNFSIAASGQGLHYQWQVSTDGGATFTDINGETGANITLSNINPTMNNNQYRAILYSNCNIVGNNSNAALLTVLAEATITSSPANVSGCINSSASFNVGVSATGASYQWQVSTDGGLSYTNINGETSDTLRLNNLTAAMNNNKYRAIISANPCGATSATATLTILPNPIVVVTANPGTALLPGMTTTLTATSTPSASSFNWYKDGNIISGVNGNTLTVSYDQLGTYTAKNTEGCDNLSNAIIVSDSVSIGLYISPNPNNGQFSVRYPDGNSASTKRMITLYDSKGARVYQKEYPLTSSAENMEVNIKHLSAGTYMLILSDNSGVKIATAKIVKL